MSEVPWKWQQLAGIAAGEQAIMYFYAPEMPLPTRLSVSAVMLAVHLMRKDKPLKMWEPVNLYWMAPVAALGYYLTGNPNTATALFSMDGMMTTIMEGFIR